MVYVKQSWSNLPDKTTPVSAARLAHMETQYDEAVAVSKDYTDSKVARSQSSANVKDFGAVGDNVSDDTEAFNRAIDSLKPTNGGTLIIPPGVYHVSGRVWLISNLHIVGEGVPIIQKKQSSSYIAVFMGLAGSSLGPRSGVNNVSCKGVHFRGDFKKSPTETSRGVTAFSFNRGSGLTVTDCTFTECVATGHTFDLGGTYDVYISRCSFSGYAGVGSDECIQIDQSKRGSITSSPPSEVYDGTLSCNWVIRNCSFIPEEVGGIKYGAPNPLGNHTQREGKYFRNITFSDNYILDPVEDTTSAASAQQYRGVLAFLGIDGLSITGNTFETTSPISARVISIYLTATGNPVGQDPNVESPTGAIAPQGCKNVFIRGNSFQGFVSGVNTSLYIYGVSNPSSGFTRNISISGNSWMSASTGSSVRLENCSGVSLVDNVFDTPSTSPQIVLANRVVGAVVSGNVSTASGVVTQNSSTSPPGSVTVALNHPS